MPQNNEVPGVSVGRELEAPHALWNDVSCEWGGYVVSLHHQLRVDVSQDVGHCASTCSPHSVSGVLVVLEVCGHNL